MKFTPLEIRVICWNSLALLAIIVFIGIITRYVQRTSDDDLSAMKKQANCAHGVTYFDNGQKRCAACGKAMPRVTRPPLEE